MKLQAGHYIAPGPLLCTFSYLAAKLTPVQLITPSSGQIKAPALLG
jgi:hypothetical protein